MPGPDPTRPQPSRRQFLHTCSAAGGAACGMGAASKLLAAQTTTSSPYRYRPVSGWPTLPDRVVMVGVNGIALDDQGRVYAAGGEPNAVMVFAPDGKFLRAWGEDTIKAKHGLRIFGDRVYVADTELHQVYEFDLEGKLLRAFGTRGKAGEGENEFNQPTDIAFAPNGDIYISDGYGNSRVVCLKPDGSFRFAWGSKGTRPGEFHYPHNVVIDSKSRVYIADRGNDRIQVFTPGGRFLTQWQDVGKPFGLFLTPEETLFVADGNPKGPHRVLVLDLEGRQLAAFGRKGDAPGQFNVPHSIHVDDNGNLYVAEVENKRIQKLTAE